LKRGFMDFAVNSIIPASPGQTAQWIAEEALAHISDLSDAQDPVASLANTLSKQVQTGKERRISRERIGGVYCYFPVSGPSVSDSSEDIVAQISLSTQELEDIDNLVAVVGKFDNRSSAIKWLVTEGIKANRAYLDKVADTQNQIERLKREVATA